MSDIVTCAGLQALCEPTDARVAVLMLLKPVTGDYPNGQIQFVTWGRAAVDKVESHNLREWIKNEVFDGDVPVPEAVYESFILDAAKNKEAKDTLLVAAKRAVAEMQDSTCIYPACECAGCQLAAAIAKAEGK